MTGRINTPRWQPAWGPRSAPGTDFIRMQSSIFNLELECFWRGLDQRSVSCCRTEFSRTLLVSIAACGIWSRR